MQHQVLGHPYYRPSRPAELPQLQCERDRMELSVKLPIGVKRRRQRAHGTYAISKL
jgi:hypothetical protein